MLPTFVKKISIFTQETSCEKYQCKSPFTIEGFALFSAHDWQKKHAKQHNRFFGGGLLELRQSETLELAADAALDFRSFERLLTNADVIECLDALAPCVDLRLVEITRGCGVWEEQRQ